MADEHWFDTLHKLLTHDAPRRGVLGALALTFGQHLGATDAAARNGGKGEKNKGKKSGNGNGKKKGKGNDKKHRKRKDKKNDNGAGNGAEPTPNPPQSCSNGSCAQEWAGDQAEINYCEFICRQCDGDDPRDFCILEDGGGDKVADCCEHGEMCCGDACCPSDLPCCGGNCGCLSPANPASKCCDGQCFDTAISPDHCGFCFNACGPNEVCWAGECICHDQSCPPGQLCYNGNNQYCSGQTSIDCQCGCGGSNYCPHPVHGAVCQSPPC